MTKVFLGHKAKKDTYIFPGTFHLTTIDKNSKFTLSESVEAKEHVKSHMEDEDRRKASIFFIFNCSINKISN